MNVSEYLIARLKSLGVDHTFGVPGDFILPFFETLASSDIKHVAVCNELNAGYAADGYARLKGIGVAVVTYGPGAFSLFNAVAGAHAEDIPMVVISGAPPTTAYKAEPRPVLHHVLRDDYEASIEAFKTITAYACLLDEPGKASAEIDKALSICLAHKKPVYLEIPADMQRREIDAPQPLDVTSYITSDKKAAGKAAEVLVDRIIKGKRTILLPGHEIHRWNLEEKVLGLLEKTGLPAATTLVGKAEFTEHLPNCIGAYIGAGSTNEVRTYVEEADTVIYLGAVPSDLNLGGFTAKLSEEQMVTIWNSKVEMIQGSWLNVAIVDLIDELLERLPDEIGGDGTQLTQCFPHKPDSHHRVHPDALLSCKRFYDRLAGFFQPHDIVIADASCSFNLTHLQLPADTTFIASNYWAAIGMGFGASLGACFAADEGQRVVAVEGDGSFQMTAQELSTMIRYRKDAVIFVVNNGGYTAERLIHDGEFNDIPPWKYHKLPEAFGGGSGVEVRTEQELESALEGVSGNTSGVSLIEVHLDPYDVSEEFRAMCMALRSH